MQAPTTSISAVSRMNPSRGAHLESPTGCVVATLLVATAPRLVDRRRSLTVSVSLVEFIGRIHHVIKESSHG
jgi:hypothetical protein